MIYQDFDLLIDRSGDKLRAQVLNSPAGQAMAEFCLPFSDDKLENFLLRSVVRFVIPDSSNAADEKPLRRSARRCLRLFSGA